jgi:ferredoxin
MTVNAVLCQGCGACAAACPSGAINVHHFTFDQFIRQIEALSDWHFQALPVLEPLVPAPPVLAPQST